MNWNIIRWQSSKNLWVQMSYTIDRAVQSNIAVFYKFVSWFVSCPSLLYFHLSQHIVRATGCTTAISEFQFWQRGRLFYSLLHSYRPWSTPFFRSAALVYPRNSFQASAAMFIRSALFWDIARRRVVSVYRRFGATYRSHLQGSRALISL
jgi:hypothetical protein